MSVKLNHSKWWLAAVLFSVFGVTGCQDPGAAPAGGKGATVAVGSDGGGESVEFAPEDPEGTAPKPSGLDYTIWSARKQGEYIKIYYRKDKPGPFNYRLVLTTRAGEVLYADLEQNFGRASVGAVTELELSLMFAFRKTGLRGAKLHVVRQANRRRRILRGEEEIAGEVASNSVDLEVPKNDKPPKMNFDHIAKPTPQFVKRTPRNRLRGDAQKAWDELVAAHGEDKTAVVVLEGIRRVPHVDEFLEHFTHYEAEHPEQSVRVIKEDRQVVVVIAPVEMLESLVEALALGDDARIDSSENSVRVDLAARMLSGSDKRGLQE